MKRKGSKKKIFWITLICCLVTGTCAAYQAVRSFRPSIGRPYETLTVDEAEEYLSYEQNSIVVDVREPALYREGHLNGAVSLPYGQIVHKAPDLLQDMEQNIYVYGEDEEESCRAAQKLSDMGYTSVAEIGSYSMWIEKESETESEGLMAELD